MCLRFWLLGLAVGFLPVTNDADLRSIVVIFVLGFARTAFQFQLSFQPRPRTPLYLSCYGAYM